MSRLMARARAEGCWQSNGAVVDLIRFGNEANGLEKIACGRGAKTLVIAGVGTSESRDDLSLEQEKVVASLRAGADMIADHSFFGDIDGFQRRMIRDLGARLSVVASYELAVRYRDGPRQWHVLRADDVLSLIEEQVSRGIDVITLHASLVRSDMEQVMLSHRVIPMTSKGGGVLAEYMEVTGEENPYWAHYEEILDLLRGTGVAISLGTTFRPGSVCDEWDDLTATEVRRMGELVSKAGTFHVPVIVEGLGHVSLDRIPDVIARTKQACSGAPFRVLTVATDRALGADHVAGAIAAAVAVACGANLISTVTRREHLGRPSVDDLTEGVTTAKVAAAIGDLAFTKDYSAEQLMSSARWKHGCRGDVRYAISSFAMEQALGEAETSTDDTLGCSMCGEFCAIGFARPTNASR